MFQSAICNLQSLNLRFWSMFQNPFYCFLIFGSQGLSIFLDQLPSSQYCRDDSGGGVIIVFLQGPDPLSAFPEMAEATRLIRMAVVQIQGGKRNGPPFLRQEIGTHRNDTTSTGSLKETAFPTIIDEKVGLTPNGPLVI